MLQLFVHVTKYNCVLNERALVFAMQLLSTPNKRNFLGAKALVLVFTMQEHPMTKESWEIYTNGIIGFRFRQAIILHRTNKALVHYELLLPITNQFVFVFIFVLAHEQAIT